MIETVKTENLEMEYLRFGKGNRTLVILPGLSVQSVLASSAAIEDAFRLFTEEFTVYLFDRRLNMPEKYSVYEMAEDTAEAMNALAFNNIYMFGASQGGMIAMRIAANFPHLIKKLAVGSSSSKVTAKQYSVLNDWVTLAKERKAKDLYLAFGEKLYSAELFAQYRDFLIAVSETVTDSELSRFITCAEGTKNFDISDDLNKIQCPTYIIGEHSDAVLGGEASIEIAEHMKGNPKLKFYMYSGYGHAVYDTAPDYRKRLYNFFTE